jgi:hypothetical protein
LKCASDSFWIQIGFAISKLQVLIEQQKGWHSHAWAESIFFRTRSLLFKLVGYATVGDKLQQDCIDFTQTLATPRFFGRAQGFFRDCVVNLCYDIIGGAKILHESARVVFYV